MLCGLKAKMYRKYCIVFVCVFVGIYCENLWDNDEIENDQVMLERRRLTAHYNRHSLNQNDGEPSTPQQHQHHRRVLSDEPLNDERSVAFGAVDRKNVRRTNLRRRKMGSNNNKKNIFRRGQRHRHNKNGNSFFQDNKSISFHSLHSLLLITQSRQ